MPQGKFSDFNTLLQDFGLFLTVLAQVNKVASLLTVLKRNTKCGCSIRVVDCSIRVFLSELLYYCKSLQNTILIT